jgi:hypothetical protein
VNTSKDRNRARTTSDRPAETGDAQRLELSEEETATAAGGLNFAKIEFEYKPQRE